ncbi:polysaccharide deacetylase family protein [Polymorphospora sp. NPDC050346]|uniref:polysaccharide deacetylase family protein n=1 Tax=Polymorphospora sp. NPDC050346 TaxID=3155780 RepID=UPI0033DB63E1
MPAGAAAVLAAGMLAHAVPSLAAISALRRRAFPDLAGVGAPTGIALTFDDGPDRESTPAFLHMLAEMDVQATFFLLGRMLDADPGLGREIVAHGHEVAVRGWDHRCLLWRTPRSTYREIARTRDRIVEVTGAVPRWYRPPYGVLTAGALSACRRLALQPRLWTAWGRDWEAGRTATAIQRTVIRTLGAGGTVLLHDSDCTSAPGSWRATLRAVPGLVEWARLRGLDVGPLRRHHRLDGEPDPP